MIDKERFDQIFHSNKHFRYITDADFIRAACECERLFNYLQDDGVELEKELDVKKYMQFAFWLGMIEKKYYKTK